VRTPDERLTDFRRRLQPVVEALRRGQAVDIKVIYALMRERFLEVDDISADKRVDRLVALAGVHIGVDDEQAIALLRDALELAPELDRVRRRLTWLEREVARTKVHGTRRTHVGWRRGVRAIADVMKTGAARQREENKPRSPGRRSGRTTRT
jgi:hypothetical protein